MPSSPAAPASAPESLRVATGDGHEARLLLAAGPAAGPIGLLWLPALGVPARKYRHFAAALAERGIPVALHEWRGLESSNRRAARDCNWGYAQLLHDVAASHAALAGTFPSQGWVIGGHSLGAQLAALALARDPADYAGYVLVGSGHPWWRTFPGWHKAGLLAVTYGFRALAALCGYFPGQRTGFAGREARGVMQDWAASARSGDYRPAQVDVDVEARLREVSVPALALRLRSDAYAPAASLEHLLAKLPRLQLRRDILDDAEFSGGRAGHFEWMRDPEPVVRRIAEWLAGIR